MLPSTAQLLLPTDVLRLVADNAVSVTFGSVVVNRSFYFGYWYSHWRA